MAYCPQCRSEYKAGIETCAACKVPLVAELEKEVEAIGAGDETAAVGVTTLHTLGRTVEVGGKTIDLMRVFTYDEAVDLKQARAHLAAFGFFRDRRPDLYGRISQDI